MRGPTTPTCLADEDGARLRLRMAEGEAGAILDWILESQLLELLMSPEYLHPELLKRCARIPVFMVDRGALGDAHLGDIWRAAVTSGHESIKHAVYNLLLELLDRLDDPQIHVLYGRLRALPPAEHDSQSLLLVNKFADAATGLAAPGDPAAPLGYDLLWHLAQESTPVRSELHEIAVNNLLQAANRLFLDHAWTARARRDDGGGGRARAVVEGGRLWLLERAVEGVRNRRSCIPCHFLITTILRMWPVENKGAGPGPMQGQMQGPMQGPQQQQGQDGGGAARRTPRTGRAPSWPRTTRTAKPPRWT
mmetsp:Transcript_17304/g.34434  ORF Transcript_17304/g.34434 Transcript_17304/m.34434 type:complete len:307 (+) Transcript_17304:126-1046(+)